MNYFQQFLESSTIHGLVHISTSQQFSRLFWIFVVFTGFSISTLLINDAFDNWAKSPIKTTIETKPISDLEFPKVTVCPPRNTFTDLNYDLIASENMTVSNETRQQLIDITLSEFYDPLYKQSLNNLKMLHEENRLENWYKGTTKISYPYHDNDNSLNFQVSTSVTVGSLKTQFFGETIDVGKIESFDILIEISTPKHVVKDPKFTLTLEIERQFLENDLDVMEIRTLSGDTVFTHDHGNRSFNTFKINGPDEILQMILTRKVTKHKIDTNLEDMPGVSIKWSYNQQVEPDSKFLNDGINAEFRR